MTDSKSTKDESSTEQDFFDGDAFAVGTPEAEPDAGQAVSLEASLPTIISNVDDDDDDDREDATLIASMPSLPESLRPPPSEQSDLKSKAKENRHFGRYTLIRRIGVGGMAEVFLADQDGPAGFRKRVVLKRILPHMSENQRFVEMFLQEARVAATLTHSNIVQIYELGHEGQQYFLAMEHIDGATMHQIAKICWYYNRPVPVELIIASAADAALGLHYAHNATDPDGQPAGLIHRDISPDNLMVNREGITKILDFGVAKALANTSASSTRAGELKGKLPYMAPEVIEGKTIDGRVDLYALGVCMYWLLTGQRPHKGESDAAVLGSIMSREPVSPRSLNPTIPESLDSIVMALLAKDREQRPSSGEILHDHLAALLPNRHRVVAAFVGQVLGWAKDLSQGIKPGVRPADFVAAKSCLTSSMSQIHYVEKQKLAVAHGAGEKPTANISLANAADSKPQQNPSAEKPRGIADDIASSLYKMDENSAEYSEQVKAVSSISNVTGKTDQVRLRQEPQIDSLQNVLDVDLDKPPSSKKEIVLLAVGLVSAMVLVLVLVLATNSQSAKDGDAKTLAQPALKNDQAASKKPTQAEPQAQDPVKDRQADSTVLDKAKNPDKVVDNTADAPEKDKQVEAQVDAIPGAVTKTDDGQKKREQKTQTRSSAMRSLDAIAPAHVRWLNQRKKVIAQGSGKLKIRKKARYIYAQDRQTMGLIKISLKGKNSVNFNELPFGKLSLRVKPYANAFLGPKKLGLTPFAPIDLRAGTYSLRLVYEGKEKKVNLVIRAGLSEKIKVDMTK